MEIDIETKQLEELINANYISKIKHPFYNIYLISYTKKASLEGKWNNTTLNCRGIIVDENMNILSRPFRKFFEIQQLSKNIRLPLELKYDIYEKLDGSLLVLYWVNNKPFLTTKGKFDSFQSLVGNKLFYEKYAHYFGQLNKNYTYTFELISPQTRNIVDYGDTEDLFLIDITETLTGNPINIDDNYTFFKKPKKYSISLEEAMTDRDKFPEEGYVVKFHNNFKLKIKKERYKLEHTYHQKIKEYVLNIIFNSKPIEFLLNKFDKSNYETIKDLYYKAIELLKYIDFYLKNDNIYKLEIIEIYRNHYQHNGNLRFIILKKLFMTSQYYSMEMRYNLSILNAN